MTTPEQVANLKKAFAEHGIPWPRRRTRRESVMQVPGLKSGHQMITPECRRNRGTTGAFLVAAERLLKQYDDYVRADSNQLVTWHLVLVRQDDEQQCAGHVAMPGNPKVCDRCGVHIDSFRPDDIEKLD